MVHDTLITYYLSQRLRRYIAPSKSVEAESFDLEHYSLKDLSHYINEKLADKNLAWAVNASRFSLKKEKIYSDIAKHLSYCSRNQVQMIDSHSKYFPHRLRHISSPPHFLNVKGNYRGLNSIKPVSVIGSRRCHLSSLNDSFEAAEILSDLKYTIISGGALGCDTYAHKGALTNTRHFFPTAAVLAGGLSHLYPKTNYFLFEKILDRGGALLSECLFDYKMVPRDFPIRNRIIAGMSDYLVVIDAAKRSGSFTTCQYAIDEGRELVVYSSDKKLKGGSGSLDLINSGACHLSSKSQFLDCFIRAY